MASVTFEIRGSNRVANNLRTLAALNKNVIDPVGRKWAKGVRGKLKSKPYPSQRAGQTYVRTGELANRWAVDTTRMGMWSITNTREGAGFVVGDEQASVHLGRWWQARPTIEEEIPQLTKDLSDEIERIWERD